MNYLCLKISKNYRKTETDIEIDKVKIKVIKEVEAEEIIISIPDFVDNLIKGLKDFIDWIKNFIQ